MASVLPLVVKVPHHAGPDLLELLTPESDADAVSGVLDSLSPAEDREGAVDASAEGAEVGDVATWMEQPR